MTKKLSDIEWIARRMWFELYGRDLPWDDQNWFDRQKYIDTAIEAIRLVKACKRRKK